MNSKGCTYCGADDHGRDACPWAAAGVEIFELYEDAATDPTFRSLRDYAAPEAGGRYVSVANYGQLREELAQRDAEIERLSGVVSRLNGGNAELCSRVRELEHKMDYYKSLESQQAASVGGEREAFEAWAASVGYHTERDMFQREKYQSTLTWELWRVWQARAALSPAGGVVVMPERKRVDPYRYNPSVDGWNACLDEVARLNAKPAKCDGNHGGPRCTDPECWNDEKPQANNQEGE